MKTIKRVLCVLFKHKRNGADNNCQQTNDTENNDENGEATTIKNEFQPQRAQDSIWEIILMCIGPHL